VSPETYLDQNQPRLLARLQRLIRLPTVNPPGEHYDAITALLVGELSRLGLTARRYAVPASLLRRTLPAEQHGYPRFNVLGKLRVPGATRTVHFNAHYDVVPVSGGWRHGDPFSGTVDRGWIYGRGTADMKGSIASLLAALEALRATRTPPRLNVEVSFTADEETDSVLGTQWLVEHAPIRPDYAVVMEGGEGPAVCCGHNGTLWLEVRVHGRAAHGSKPEQGVNALEHLSKLVLALQDYRTEIARRSFTTPEGKVLRPTLNIGGVFAGGSGAKINTVPAEARFSLDRRVLAVESQPAAERELRAFLAGAARRIPGCRITVAKVSENFASYTPPAHPFFAAMAAQVARVRRRPAVFNVSSGFNDMYFFAHYKRVPTLGYGPGGRDYHGVDERARVSELTASAKIYAGLLTAFAG
jgi:succinyl-diaminopimelate desuccinylase